MVAVGQTAPFLSAPMRTSAWAPQPSPPPGLPQALAVFQPGPPASGAVPLLIHALFACFHSQESCLMSWANADWAV